MSAENPYSPPVATVKDVVESADGAGFLPEGRKVAAGRGLAWITEAFSMVFAQLGPWVLMWLLMMVIIVVLSMIPLLGMVSNILLPVLFAGFIVAAAKQDAGERVEVGDLFAGFREKFGPLALVGLLFLVASFVVFGIIFAVGAVTVFASVMSGGSQALLANIGLLLLAIPVFMAAGLLVYSLIWFAPALVLRHDMQPLDAMKTSFKVTLRNLPAAIVFSLVATVVMIIAVIPFGLGLLVAGPAMSVSIYTAYRDLFLER
ncbi:BPSS1780 family membrane protein [Niveibacterium sp. 24ML]|uniref:BPSS1780 family membrane protein n=1 Tax=Niveibacterium sp. 24ML TaxID=2985512 RepID=UPI00226FE0B7|nr:BPSS1780 family membrane protein [Niveibacterium sp. 24ML]MCX9154745.1 BPSS1780 family membrane protein [Niveibacterium sp. 24ML]